MSVVAIIGAGSIGTATALKLAQRGRVREIRLIDPNPTVASGKALDILQSGPIDGFDTRVIAVGDTLAATSASVIVIADAVAEGAFDGEQARPLVETLSRSGMSSPLVFANPTHLALMESATRDFGIGRKRLVATAPSAIASAVRGLAAIELDLASVELAVVGRAPSFVVGWSAASTQGILLTDRVPPHRLIALSRAIPRLWPPGPHAIGSATANVVEALLHGSRRHHHAATILGGEYGIRGRAAMMPLMLGRGRVLDVALPSLSPAERTEFVNAFDK